MKLYYIFVILCGTCGVRQARKINSNIVNFQINTNSIKRRSYFSPTQAIYNDFYWDQNQSMHTNSDKILRIKYKPLEKDFEITPSTMNSIISMTSIINDDLRSEWLCQKYKFCNKNKKSSNKEKKILCKKSTHKLKNPILEDTTHKMLDLNAFMERLTFPNAALQRNSNFVRRNITDGADLNRKRRNVDSEDMDPLADTKKIRPLKLISKFKFPRTAHLNFHPQVINMHKHQHTSDSMDNDNQDALFLPSSFKDSVLPYNDNNKLKTTTIEPPRVKVITQPVISQHFVQPFFLPPIIDDVVQYRM